MPTASRAALPGLATLLALYLLIATAMADWDLKYCSSQNTASDTSAFYWNWQSNGKCHDYCASQGNYAFFVIQDKNCWCSNYIPAEQSDLSDCSETCPGFDTENCGKAGEYYIYVNLNGNPSGTAGASQPSSTSVSESPTSSQAASTSPPEATTPSSAPPSSSAVVATSADPSTVSSTVTSAAPVTTPSPSSSSKSSSTSQQATTTDDDPPQSTTAPQTLFRTVTDNNNGGVRTETVIVTPSATPQPELTGKSKSNTGAIVGGVVGGVGALAAVVAGVLFLLWRRRKQQREGQGDAGGQNESGVHRYASTMSKAGLLRGEKEPQYPPPIATSFNRRHSRTLDQESISPISGSDRRNSSFRIADQRLNPSTIFVFENPSRASVGSLDDSRDYHRTLNVRNPDAQ